MKDLIDRIGGRMAVGISYISQDEWTAIRDALKDAELLNILRVRVATLSPEDSKLLHEHLWGLYDDDATEQS